MPFPDEILDAAGTSFEQPLFYQQLFSRINRHVEQARAGPASPEEQIRLIASEEFDELSIQLERTTIQESCSVRNVLKARLIANMLIDETGEFRIERIPALIHEITEHLYSLGPHRAVDAMRDEHVLRVLALLQQDKGLVRLLSSMTRPVSNRIAEQVIRETLLVSEKVSVTDAHVRRACLSAWLTTLRQSLGSCFATAPAILIQQEFPRLFLHDIDEMMHTGRMQKIYAGKEHSVPMSETWGNGDLKKPFVLSLQEERDEIRIWESPGIRVAMEAVGVVSQEDSVDEKTNRIRLLLMEALPLLEKRGDPFLTNAEEVIQALLLHSHSLSNKQVEDYRMRPKGMLQSGLIMYVPKAREGKEPSVPAYLKDLEVAKSAFKSLAENALLKAWEFTLASFSEINLDFCRWNLYSSLGVNYDDVGGVGHCLYQIISGKIEQANIFLKEREEEYEQLFVNVRYIETRLRTATTEKEIEWLRVEYRSRQAELYHFEQLRVDARNKANKIAALYNFLMQEYDKRFPEYFQEVYDADLHDVTAGPFDDSPAGFRLLYKYGRSNPSQWTKIYTPSEFVDALASFFTMTEQELNELPEIKGIEVEFGQVITQLVHHAKSDEFLESAFYRMARAHQVPCPEKPLQHLDKVEKKPWVYTSGGSLHTLVSAYFKREGKPSSVARWVENETELLAFLIDTLKHMPSNESGRFVRESDRSMLMHSPTHAFLLKPGFTPFYDAWNSELYTYSWIKQKVVEPAQAFWEQVSIEAPMAQDFVSDLKSAIPIDFRPRFTQVFANVPFRSSVAEFHEFLMHSAHSDRGLYFGGRPVIRADDIAAFLYARLPYIATARARGVLLELVTHCFERDPAMQDSASRIYEQVLKRLPQKEYVSSKRLVEAAKTIIALTTASTRTAAQFHKELVMQMRALGALPPMPIVFADTNWIKDYFAFLVNPASDRLELWVVDALGIQGSPLSAWKMWLNGSKRDPQWGIFMKPHEYTA